MFTRHLLGFGRGQADYGLLMNVPDGAAGGGSVSTPDDGTYAGDDGQDPGADTGTGNDDPTAAPGANDDDDGDPLDTTQFVEHLPEPKMRTQLRRAQRFMHRARPIVDRFRDPKGQFMPMQEIDRIINNAREYEAIDNVLRRSPRALEVVLEEQRKLEGQGGAPLEAAAAAQDDGEAFDESKHPFETDTPQGQYLLEMARANHELRRTVKQLQRGFSNLTEREQRQAVEQIEGSWKSATLDAAKGIAEQARPLFIEAVYGEFVALRDRKQLTQVSSKAAIDRQLKRFEAFRKAAPPPVDPRTVRQSQIVAGNQQLPRVPRPGATTPASAAPRPGANETIREAKGSFFRRMGKG